MSVTQSVSLTILEKYLSLENTREFVEIPSDTNATLKLLLVFVGEMQGLIEDVDGVFDEVVDAHQDGTVCREERECGKTCDD